MFNWTSEVRTEWQISITDFNRFQKTTCSLVRWNGIWISVVTASDVGAKECDLLIFDKFLHMSGCKLSKDTVLTYVSLFFIAYILWNWRQIPD